MKKFKESFIPSFLLGLILPVLAGILFLNLFYRGDGTLLEAVNYMVTNNALYSKFILLCITPNLILFFTCYKLEYWAPCKAIVVTITLYLLYSLILTF